MIEYTNPAPSVLGQLSCTSQLSCLVCDDHLPIVAFIFPFPVFIPQCCSSTSGSKPEAVSACPLCL